MSMKMPQTWRSVRGTNNTGIWYLSLGPQNEAKLAHKEDQPHCSECGPVRKQQNNGNQSILSFISRGECCDRKRFKYGQIV